LFTMQTLHRSIPNPITVVSNPEDRNNQKTMLTSVKGRILV
jgi:hypothetical protein